MAASSQPSEMFPESIAERERRRAVEMTIGNVSGHIERDTWPIRAPFADVGPAEAWVESAPVHYPSAGNGCVARIHRRTDTVLLARQGALVTCIDLMDRPQWERIYIRSQVRTR